MDENSSYNMHAYDVLASVYDTADQHTQIWDTSLRTLINQHIEQVEPSAGITAIDLGCGTGEYTRLLLSKGYHVVAVDISAGMLEVASQKLFPYRDRVTTMVADVLNLDLPDQSFQAAISFGAVLNHIQDHGRFFSNVSDLLAPGSLLMFDLVNICSPSRYLSYVFRKKDRPDLKQLGRMIKSHVGSLPYTAEFPYKLGSEETQIRLTNLPVKKVTELLNNRGFEIILIDGIHILPFSRVRGMLTELDARLGRRLHRIAGIQFVIARKI